MTAIGRRGGALAALALPLCLAGPSRTQAHLGHLVLRAERYVKIDAAPGEVRVVVSLMLGPSEARRALEPADTNGDGALSRAEADAYLAGWGAELEREVRIELDDAPAEGVVWRDGVLEPIGPIAAQPVTVERIAHLALPGGEHAVRVRDAMDVARFERTDVVFQARDGATLSRAGLGAEPQDLETSLSFGSDFAPVGGRIFTASVVTPEEPADARALLAGVLGGAVLAVLAAIAWRKRGSKTT
jgi:hypothetical protein